MYATTLIQHLLLILFYAVYYKLFPSLPFWQCCVLLQPGHLATLVSSYTKEWKEWKKW